MSNLQTVCAGVVLSACAATALAAQPDYAAQLKSGEITPLGATRAGNAAGTIPAWKCGKNGVPAGIGVNPASVKGHTYPAMPNPDANEKPRFVITAQNMDQYADKLTPGLRKLFTTYPKAFRMPVYPSHRTACFSDAVYQQAALNARHAQLVNDGNGLNNAYMAPPFPLPDNGLQAIWNQIVFLNPWREEAYYDNIAVFANGSREKERVHLDIYTPYNDPHLGRDGYLNKNKGKTPLQDFLQWTIQPERNRGQLTLGIQYLHQVKNRAEVWQYLPGTRRVRRAPYFGYDTPQGAGGLRGIDDQRLFNGAPNRFNWKLAGIKEMFVPYNDYAMDAKISYQQLLGKQVINPQYTRWELHRVRKVVATLKPGARHWYGKRVLYIDEDSGHPLLADNYDRHGQLWRTGQQNYVWTPLAANTLLARAGTFYDFQARAYNIQRLINERPQSKHPRLDFGVPEADYYTPSTLRKQGLH